MVTDTDILNWLINNGKLKSNNKGFSLNYNYDYGYNKYEIKNYDCVKQYVINEVKEEIKYKQNEDRRICREKTDELLEKIYPEEERERLRKILYSWEK